MSKHLLRMICLILIGFLALGAVACTPVPKPEEQSSDAVSGAQQSSTDFETELTENQTSQQEQTTVPESEPETEKITNEEMTNPENSTEEITTEETTTKEITTEEVPDMRPAREIGERYFIYRIWNFTEQTQESFERTVDAAALAGFNAIKVHIPWSRVERVAGQYDYTPFDPMIDYVVKVKGMKVAISLDLTRRADDTVIGLDQMQRDPAGNLCQGGSVDGMRTVISFCSKSAVDAAVAFYADAVKHYHALHGNDVLFYLPAFTQYAETEYWPSGEYDYSDPAKDAFYDFLQQRYTDIDALNAVLGSAYADFSDVVPPSCTASDNLGILWYQFRHQKLKGVIDALAAAQKSIAPDSKIALQFGSHFDAASLLRCTLAAGDLAEHADIVWIDDGPESDHEFSMDYAHATFPSHIQLAQEIDGPYQVGATPEKYLEQGHDSFMRGCTYVSIANWSIDANYETYRWVWEELADTWLSENPPAVIDTTDTSRQMEIKLSQMLRRGNPSAYMSEYHVLASNGEFVCVNLIDDLTDVAVDRPQLAFAFPGGYSTEQGKGGWYYMCANPGRNQLYEMTYDAQAGRWQGRSQYSLITRGSVHPDEYDAVLVFEAPADGTLRYSYSLNVDSSQSDGIRFRVMREKDALTQGDRYGYVDLPYGAPAQGTLTVEVKTGDRIWIAINKGETSVYDSTALSVEIEYVE